MRSGPYITEILLGAAVTIITAAIIGMTSTVLDLKQSDARDQLRLEAHDRQLDELRVGQNRTAAKIEDCRLDAAQAKAACDDWVRKMKRGQRQGD